TPPSCNDGIVCTADSCDSGTDMCVHPSIPTCCDGNDDCDNHDVCDGAETCNIGTGMCHDGAPPPPRSDGDVCTLDVCDPLSGCAFAPVAGCCTTDDDCDADDPCPGAETCGLATELCQPGTPLACDDGNVCDGAETCDPLAGCQDEADLDCDDHAVCTTDTCDPGTGCTHTPIPGCCA